MSTGSVRNPLHVIIDLLILHKLALVQVHEARTDEARQQALDEWRCCHPAVWGNSNSRNDTIRTLADPAKAWLTQANSRYVELQDFNLVEQCADALSAFAISLPMSMPGVYSKMYTTEEELWQRWTEQFGRIVAPDNLIAQLKELAGRAGEVWTPPPPLQQARSPTSDASRTTDQRTPPQDPSMPSGQTDRTAANQPACDDGGGEEMGKEATQSPEPAPQQPRCAAKMSETPESESLREQARALREQKEASSRASQAERERLNRCIKAIQRQEQAVDALRRAQDPFAPPLSTAQIHEHTTAIASLLAEALIAVRAAGLLEKLKELNESATLAHYNQLGGPEENRLAYAYARQLIETDPAERELLSRLVRDAVEERGLRKAWDWIHILLAD
jgi:hypothetical protein